MRLGVSHPSTSKYVRHCYVIDPCKHRKQIIQMASSTADYGLTIALISGLTNMFLKEMLI